MSEEKNKTCVICKERILEDRERWVQLIDFDCGIQGGEVYYHLECWRERFKITNSERKKRMIQKTMQSIKSILNNSKNGGVVIEQ